MTRVLIEGRVGGGHEQLILLAKQLPVRTISQDGEDVPPLVLGALYAVDPAITFTNRTFVFTGDSQKAARPALANRVGDRGGLFEDTLTKRTDYLVVCDDGSPIWAFSCYGRKIEKAYQMRRRVIMC